MKVAQNLLKPIMVSKFLKSEECPEIHFDFDIFIFSKIADFGNGPQPAKSMCRRHSYTEKTGRSVL